MFASNIYKERRAGLRRAMSGGLLLFLGNDESPMNYLDNPYHFRQDSTFLYYFGISAAGLAAIIDLDNEETIIFGDEMDIDALVWMGQLATLRERASAAGVEDTQPYAALATKLNEANTKGRRVHFLPPYRAENQIKLHHLLGADLKNTVNAASPEFIKAVVAQRSIKSTIEIEEIERAVNLSIEGQELAMLHARPGMTEAAVAALIEERALRAGGVMAYPIILTTRGHILHNHSKINTLREGEMVLNDSGMETPEGYCGDLTRTFPVRKRFDTRQREVYNIVLNALNNAVETLRPGQRFIDTHFTACKTLAQGLKELGLMKGDVDEAVAAGAHAMFFQCGTGHMMGMDVHDMEDLGEQYVGYNDVLRKEKQLFGLKSLRLGKELEPGYVLTVEPGVYINPFLIDLWKSEKRFEAFINYQELEKHRDFTGIRIEDNYVITETGHRLLGRHLAKTVDEVEQLRASAF